MRRNEASRRRLTLRDTSILVASIAVGCWLGSSYHVNERHVWPTPGVADSFWSWAQATWLVLMPVQLGLLGLSLLPPRPPMRRLARQPGFVAGIAVACAVASNVLQASANLKQNLARGTNPLPTWIHNNLIGISAPYRLAPVVLLAWVIVGLQGGCRRSRDWVESGSRLLGGIWVTAWCVYMIISVCN
jgi:hypothetical protein